MSETPHFISKEAIETLAKLTKSEFNKASQSITITLSTTWTYDSTNKYYTQSVLVTGIKATDKPVLGIDDSVDNAEEANSEWSKVFHAETYDGGIKFYAKSATTKNLTVLVKPDLSKVTINNVSSEEAGLDALDSKVNELKNNINVTNGVHAFAKYTDSGTQVTFTIKGTVHGEAMLLLCEENISRASMFIITSHGNNLYSSFNVFKSSSSTAAVEVTEKQIIVTAIPWSSITLYTASNLFE